MTKFYIVLKDSTLGSDDNYHFTFKDKKLTVSDGTFIFESSSFIQGMKDIDIHEVKSIRADENKHSK